MKELTERLGFEAMRLFLDGYRQRTQSDDVGALLGDLSPQRDGDPLDPAAWADWLACFKHADAADPVMRAYLAMFGFLSGFYERTRSDDVGALCGDLQLGTDDVPADPAAWSDWQDCVRRVTNER